MFDCVPVWSLRLHLKEQLGDKHVKTNMIKPIERFSLI